MVVLSVVVCVWFVFCGFLVSLLRDGCLLFIVRLLDLLLWLFVLRLVV